MTNNKGSILIVDDDISVMNMLNRVLGSWGYKVSGVRGIENALMILKNIRFDLILIDYRISPVRGKEFLSDIRKRKIKSPVIMISGYWTMDGWFEMKSLGAIAYLAKPLDFALLKRVISRALSYYYQKSYHLASLPSAS